MDQETAEELSFIADKIHVWNLWLTAIAKMDASDKANLLGYLQNGEEIIREILKQDFDKIVNRKP